MESSQPDTFGYDMKYVQLTLSATDTSSFIQGNAQYKIQLTGSNRSSISFQLNSHQVIDSVKLEERNCNFHQDEFGVHCLFDSLIDSGSYLNISFFYQGDSKGSGFFAGITNRMDYQWNTPVTYTLSEPFSAMDWFPVKQILSDKIDSSDVKIRVPSYLKAGSNGILVSIDSLEGDRIQYHWKSRYPIAYYLLSFTVANYQEFSFYAHPKGSDSILIQNYIYNVPGIIEKLRPDIEEAARLMSFYDSLLIPYPFQKEKYGHCMAPMGGGMENQTMTTLSSFSFGLVAHELAHSWFGNLVTCSTWSDIWINEGFASYLEYLAFEFLRVPNETQFWMDYAHQQAFSATSGSVFVPAEDAQNELRIFSSSLSYKKGAVILHMLRFEIGDEYFFKLLREFLKKFRYANASGEDFKMLAEEISGKDLDFFFNQWYYGFGYPKIDISFSTTKKHASIFAAQTSTSEETPVFHFPLQLLLKMEHKDSLITLQMDGNSVQLEIDLPAQLIGIEVDPSNWILNKSSVYQIQKEGKYMNVYPNPVSGEFTLDFLQAAKEREISLLNMDGKIVFRITTEENSARIKMNHLAGGVFLLRVNESGREYITRIVKYP